MLRVCCSKRTSFPWALLKARPLGGELDPLPGETRTQTRGRVVRLVFALTDLRRRGVTGCRGEAREQLGGTARTETAAHLSGVWWWKTAWLRSPAGNTHLSSQPCSRRWSGTGLSPSEAARGEDPERAGIVLSSNQRDSCVLTSDL